MTWVNTSEAVTCQLNTSNSASRYWHWHWPLMKITKEAQTNPKSSQHIKQCFTGMDRHWPSMKLLKGAQTNCTSGQYVKQWHWHWPLMKITKGAQNSHTSGHCIKQCFTGTDTDLQWRQWGQSRQTAIKSSNSAPLAWEDTDLWQSHWRVPEPIICQVNASNSESLALTFNEDSEGSPDQSPAWSAYQTTHCQHLQRRHQRWPAPVTCHCQADASNSTPPTPTLTFDEDAEGGHVGDDSILLQVDRVLGLVRQPRLLDLQPWLARWLVGWDGDARVFPQLPASAQVVDIGHGFAVQGHLNLHLHALTCEGKHWWTRIVQALGERGKILGTQIRTA